MTSSSYSSGVSESRTYNNDPESGIGFQPVISHTATCPTFFLRSYSNLNQAWNLSLVGDWTSITENSSTQNRTHGPTHELVSVASQNVTHDAKGNMTLIPAVLRGSSQTPQQPLKMKWDFENKLLAVDIDNDSTDDVFYKFDALGRRVARTANSATMIYFQSGQQTIADYTAGTAASSPTYNYVYTSYIDEPVMRSTGSSGAKHFFHRNQQYSITALTDASGTIVERYAYTAYGTPPITDASGSTRTTTAIGNRYTYTGCEWDETLALYHYRARMYDAVAGRFVSKAPISYFGSRWNLYEYTRSIPLSYLDPWGLDGTVATPGAPPGIQPSIPGTKPPLTFPQRPFQPSVPSGVKPLPLPTTKPISPGKPPIGRTWHSVWFEVCKEIGAKIDEEAEISRSCMEYDCQMHLKRINSNLPPDPYPEKCWNEYLAGARQCEDDYPPSVDPDGTSYQNCIDTKEQILRKCTIDAGWPDPG